MPNEGDRALEDDDGDEDEDKEEEDEEEEDGDETKGRTAAARRRQSAARAAAARSAPCLAAVALLAAQAWCERREARSQLLIGSSVPSGCREQIYETVRSHAGLLPFITPLHEVNRYPCIALSTQQRNQSINQSIRNNHHP